MKFSIIVPVYNVEDYLAACVDSVLHQQHADWELILVDDGSSDSSSILCDQYATCHPDRIRVFHSKNQGPHMARMQGVDHASGDAVLFMDSDDALRADALALLDAAFAETGADMICFNASREADFSTAFYHFPFADGQSFSAAAKAPLYQALILDNNMNALCLKSFRRELLSAIPVHCRTFSGRNAEDLWLLLPLITAASMVLILQQNFYYYRSRPGSIVHSYNPLRHRSIKTVHREMEKYIDLWGMQHMHGLHYAREVRGWVDCLLMVLGNEAHPDMKIIRELAGDEYFRSAYDRMDQNALSRRYALLAGLLHGKHYLLLRLAGRALRAFRAAKNLLKGKRTS